MLVFDLSFSDIVSKVGLCLLIDTISMRKSEIEVGQVSRVETVSA